MGRRAVNGCVSGGPGSASLMSNILTFEGRPPEGTINFGVGQPSANLLPFDLVQEATEAFFQTSECLDLNYGSWISGW